MRDLNPKFLIEHCPGERISLMKTDRNTISLQYVAAERYARHAHTSFGYDVFRLEKCQSLSIESEQEILTRVHPEDPVSATRQQVSSECHHHPLANDLSSTPQLSQERSPKAAIYRT